MLQMIAAIGAGLGEDRIGAEPLAQPEIHVAVAREPQIHARSLPGRFRPGAADRGSAACGARRSVASIHDALVHSPLHYANMVDPSFNWIGVGVAFLTTILLVLVVLAPSKRSLFVGIYELLLAAIALGALVVVRVVRPHHLEGAFADRVDQGGDGDGHTGNPRRRVSRGA